MRMWIVSLVVLSLAATASAAGVNEPKKPKETKALKSLPPLMDTEVPKAIEPLKGGKVEDVPMMPENAQEASAKPKADAKATAGAAAAGNVADANAAAAKDAASTKSSDTEKPEAAGTDNAAGPAPEKPPLASAVPKERMPTLSLKVTPKEATVGQSVTWELSVKRKQEDSVHLEGGASFGGLEIQTKDKAESPASDGWVVETLKVSLVGFDPGDIVIPEQKLTIVDVEGRISEVMTDKAFVTVKSLLGNEPEPKLKEDKGQGEVVMEKNYLLLWISIVILGMAATAGLTLLGRKLWSMRKPKPLPPPPPPRPAEVIAYEKLETLKRSNLLAEGQIKEFHVRLSEAVREYIGNRYRFDSLEMSSEELIQAIRRINMTRSEYELILDFLGETDLVKFAKALPTVKESEDLLVQSFGFVDRTTPKTHIDDNATKPASETKEADRA